MLFRSLITNDPDEAILLADRVIPLTAGPNATLGMSIPITIPRPRDRKTIANHAEGIPLQWREFPIHCERRSESAARGRGRRPVGKCSAVPRPPLVFRQRRVEGFKNRVQPFELDAGVGGVEQPIGLEPIGDVVMARHRDELAAAGADGLGDRGAGDGRHLVRLGRRWTSGVEVPARVRFGIL